MAIDNIPLPFEAPADTTPVLGQVTGEVWVRAVAEEREGARYDEERNDPKDYGDRRGGAVVAVANVTVDSDDIEEPIVMGQLDIFSAPVLTEREIAMAISRSLAARRNTATHASSPTQQVVSANLSPRDRALQGIDKRFVGATREKREAAAARRRTGTR